MQGYFFQVDREKHKQGCTLSTFHRYFMFVRSSSEFRNIHSRICVYVSMCVCVYCVYIYIHVNPHICVAECGSPGHVRKPQGWQEPVMRQMKRQSDPAVAPAAAEPQRGERPGCAGGRRALPGPGPPPSPHSTAWGALGDTRVLRDCQSHPDISVTSGDLGTFFACLSTPNSSRTCSNGW